jgi:hypothetical protein
MTPTNATVAAAVRAELARAGVSRRQLARHLGVAPSYLDRRLAPPSSADDCLPAFPIEQLSRVADVLGIPLSRLLEPEPDHERARC